MTSLRVGVSGTGAVARRAVQRVRLHEDCDIVAVHDDDLAAAQGFATTHDLGFATGDYTALLAYGVDFVLLTGDMAARGRQVEQAAEQVVHCLLAAPFAGDLASARRMATVCNDAGVKLGIAVPELADPVIEQLRLMIVADWLGGVVAVQAIAGNGDMLGDPRPAQVPDPFFGVVSPMVHLASWLLGRSMVTVTAQAQCTFRPDLADAAVATATLRGGALCSFVGSRMCEANAIAVHGTDGGVRIAGDRIWMRGRKEHRGRLFDYLVPGRDVSLSRDELAAVIAAANARADACGRFARWIEDTDDFPCPAEQALLDLEAVEAMRRASASGRTEAV